MVPTFLSFFGFLYYCIGRYQGYRKLIKTAGDLRNEIQGVGAVLSAEMDKEKDKKPLNAY
jgi:hypothetical protein